MQETIIEQKKDTIQKRRTTSAKQPSKIEDISVDSETRIMTGLSELDRVLGGGLVKGSLILVGGDPGIGKSTLLLQLCQSSGQKILYVSGEESERQIKIRAQRLGVTSSEIYIVSETDVESIIENICTVKPDIVIIDSIQTMYSEEISAAARKCKPS